VDESVIAADELVSAFAAQENRDQGAGVLCDVPDPDRIGMVERLIQVPGRLIHGVEERVALHEERVYPHAGLLRGDVDPVLLRESRVVEDNREGVNAGAFGAGCEEVDQRRVDAA